MTKPGSSGYWGHVSPFFTHSCMVHWGHRNSCSPRPAGIALGQDYALAYGYDTAGRFGSVTANFGNGDHTATYGYLPGSNLVSGYSLGNLTRTVTYETNRNLVDIVENTYGAAAISKFDYTNDAIGRRTGREDSGSAFASTQGNVFGYNLRSEVESATMRNGQSNYTHDPIGNRIEVTLPEEPNPIAYTANVLNQYAAITGRTNPAHDDDGNMLDDGAGLAMAWDGENRLIQTVGDTKTVTYAYDYMSRRVQKTVFDNTDLGSPISDLRYLYDGWLLVREQSASGGNISTSHYVWGLDLSQSLQGAGGVGGLLMVSGPDGIFAPAYDANGNISEYISLANGAIASHREYDAFGRVIATTGAAPSAFGFSTKYTDGGTGLLYYGYRYYSPSLGRWPSRDPIEEEGGANLYGFVGNRPMDLADIFGLCPSGICKNQDPQKPHQKCCVDVAYDSRSHSCEDKKVVAKEDQTFLRRLNIGGADHIDVMFPDNTLYGFYTDNKIHVFAPADRKRDEFFPRDRPWYVIEKIARYHKRDIGVSP